MELSKIFLILTNGNGIMFNGIPFPFPSADRTNGIPPSIKACGSMRKHAAANGNRKLTELSKFILTETNRNGTFENYLNGNEWK